jgi:hypothetical protein
VYAPVKRFVSDALVVMETSGPGGGDGFGFGGGGAHFGTDGGSATAAVPGSPRRQGTAGSGGAARRGDTWLLASLEAYVAEVFLPQVGSGTRGKEREE